MSTTPSRLTRRIIESSLKKPGTVEWLIVSYNLAEGADVLAENDGASLLSLFWTPLVAVGCSDGPRLNAQISVSIFGASIVPDRPRLLSVIYKGNYTHDLVRAKGSFSISALASDQADLLRPLGFVSGREHDKLAGLDVELTPRGNPVLTGSLGWLECEVIATFDLGDATAFLGAVLATKRYRTAEPLLWYRVRHALPESWLAEWERKITTDIERSRASMLWRE
jgi:flavin reductase (DIM6/NTAB) family NADH-FMN oxidoreductase RutF